MPSTVNALPGKLGVYVRPVNPMLWKIALYLAITWGVVCAVLTITAFAGLGYGALRNRLRGRTESDPQLVPVDEYPLLTTQPNRRRPG